jgi:hypothetical protein
MQHPRAPARPGNVGFAQLVQSGHLVLGRTRGFVGEI